MPDLEALHRLLWPDLTVYMAVVKGNPPPKLRVRCGKGGRAYKVDDPAEQATGYQLRRAFRGTLRGPIVVSCGFYRSDERQVDYDNLLKHLYDAGNGVLWADDHQIIGGFSYMTLDRSNPRTIVVISPLEA